LTLHKYWSGPFPDELLVRVGVNGAEHEDRFSEVIVAKGLASTVISGQLVSLTHPEAYVHVNVGVYVPGVLKVYVGYAL
jgi:hypothetical protein